MNLLIVDTETTGLTPADARCIEVGGILFSTEERAVLGQCSFLLPTDENPVAHINGIRAELTKCSQAAQQPAWSISMRWQNRQTTSWLIMH
jgi:DNA polymerase III subunit epsilon